MRNLDATLKAEMESGAYEPFFELQLRSDPGGVPEKTITVITKYTLSPFGDLEIEGLFDWSTEDQGDCYRATLRRGIVKNGTQYYLDTSELRVETLKLDGYYIRIKASITPPQKISIAGDDSYWNIIQEYCTSIGMTASRKEASETYWNNQFLPTGKMVIQNHSAQFRNLIKQKYFMNFTDAGNNTLLFWSAKNFGAAREYTITIPQIIEATFKKFSNGYVALLWRNDAAEIFQPAPPVHTELPRYNLGYIKNGDAIPVPGNVTNASASYTFVKGQSSLPKPLTLPVNLEYLTGDYVTITSSTTGLSTIGYLLITEYLDTKRTPSWGLEISLWDFVSNTEGGALPSTIERVAAYTPLVSTGFDGNLTPAVNNLQALAQAVDDMVIAGTPAWADVTGAVEGAQDAVGAMIADTATIDLTYTDATPELKADVKAASITEAMQVLADNTTQDASTTKHGYLKKLSNVATEFMNGQGAWATPAGGGSSDGWTAGTGTWSYSSADAPTFVISVNNDQTGIIGVGQRIKLTQTTAKYFIVTAVGAYSGGATLITVYGGTDYTLANAAISTPFWSNVKAPFGFPMSPAKWTVTVTDTSDRTQASPTINVWYNLGSVSISAPIGIWKTTPFTHIPIKPPQLPFQSTQPCQPRTIPNPMPRTL
jgi:hypothetical protein